MALLKNRIRTDREFARHLPASQWQMQCQERLTSQSGQEAPDAQNGGNNVRLFNLSFSTGLHQKRRRQVLGFPFTPSGRKQSWKAGWYDRRLWQPASSFCEAKRAGRIVSQAEWDALFRDKKLRWQSPAESVTLADRA